MSREKQDKGYGFPFLIFTIWGDTIHLLLLCLLFSFSLTSGSPQPYPSKFYPECGDR